MAQIARPESTAWQDWQDLYDFIDQIAIDLGIMTLIDRPESTAWLDWQDLYDFIDRLRADIDISNGIFFQDSDPGAVGTRAVWVDFANERVGIRNDDNTAWNFYSAAGGIGVIGSSGYGIGEYGNIPWDETAVNSSVLTSTPSLGLYKPLYATVGWGTWWNANLDKIEALNVRLLAAEAAVL
jgi:hypothetical protein